MTSSCGNDDSFHISGEVDGLGTRNLRFYYYDGNALKTGMASAIDGKFSFTGSSKKPSLLTVTTAQRTVLAHIVVKNGDAIELKLNSADPLFMEVKGNKTSIEYADFLKQNSKILSERDADAINRVIEKLVADNNNKLSTTVAFLLHYEFRDCPTQADSILDMINPDARPQQFIAGYRSQLDRFNVEIDNSAIEPFTMFCSDDTLTTFNPAGARRSLLVFTKGTSARLDSINAAVDSVAPEKNNNTSAVINIALDTDTATWKQTLADAPARGLNLWAPGAVSSTRLHRFGITRLPMFIVTDSAGNCLYRGESVTEAISYFKK